MANQYVNKVQLADGSSIIDISDTTAIPSDVAQGKYFYGADGEKKVGTASGGGTGAIGIEDTLDAAGGTIRTITAVDLSNDTVAADKLLQGYTAHGATGAPITGSYVPQTGVDIPTFTLGNNNQVTCDKTFAECAALVSNGNKTATLNDNGQLIGLAVELSDVSSFIIYGYSPEQNTRINVTYGIGGYIRYDEEITPYRVNSDITVSGATVDVPYGIYRSDVSKSVASGTAGTPVATKGTRVGNHISITPTVTNTAGYIAGGTLTGTPVTVYASEVATATLYCDGAGNWSVTDAATFVVASGSVGNPTATKGTVSNHSVTVTPSVTSTDGWIDGSTKTGTGVTVTAAELVSGSETKTANGTYDVTNLASLVVNVSGTSKNAQIVQGTTRTNSSTLTAIGAELTVSKAGTYHVYWSGMRSNTSSSYTWSTQLYVDGTAYGSENTTWTNNVQNIHLTNVSLTANQKLRVYGRNTRGTSYYVYAPTLIIIEA